MTHAQRGILLTVFSMVAAVTLAAADINESRPASAHADPNELKLIQALSDITAARIDNALAALEKLVEANPDFKLAQIVYADLLQAKALPLQGFGPNANGGSEQVDDLLAEARARWNHYASHPPSGRIPAYFVQLEPRQRTALLVDVKESRLFLYENKDGRPVLVDDYYVSIGKNGVVKQSEGDKRTPLGVYFITDYLSPDVLPDFYGAGAFPINYPNAWDRLRNKSGSGIWLHGNPVNTFSRAPRASDGCVTMSNADLKNLKPFLHEGHTPVIIAAEVEWREPEAVEQYRTEFTSLLEQWRTAWESRDSDRYLQYYSTSFNTEGKTYRRWAREKRAVNSTKSYIKVELSNVSILTYPGDEKVSVVTFRQDYRSNNFNGSGDKRQYWRQEADGQWRIVYEGEV